MKGPHLHARLQSHAENRLPARDIIFDPNILTVATGIGGAQQLRRRFLRGHPDHQADLSPHAKVSGGVSNVSFSFRGNNPMREAMHTGLLYHAIREGYGHGDRQRRHVGRLPRDPPGPARKSGGRPPQPPPRRHRAAREFADDLKAQQRRRVESRNQRDPCSNASVEERLSHALVKGIDQFIEADTEEARANTMIPAPTQHHRGPAHGRHEDGGRSLWLGENVSPAGREVRARDEEIRRLSHAVHGGGKRQHLAGGGTAKPNGRIVAWPPSRATSTTSARTSSASSSPATTTRSPTSA